MEGAVRLREDRALVVELGTAAAHGPEVEARALAKRVADPDLAADLLGETEGEPPLRAGAVLRLLVVEVAVREVGRSVGLARLIAHGADRGEVVALGERAQLHLVLHGAHADGRDVSDAI